MVDGSGGLMFAWELGGNWGHLSKDLSVARLLRKKGCEVQFAVRDCRIAMELLVPDGFSFVQAPIPLGSPRLRIPPVNYAEILLISGYADPAMLQGLVTAWISLFSAMKPRALVIDHAPTALLAARIAGLPVVLLGSGFEIPPAVSPFPSIRPWQAVEPARLQYSERMALSSANASLIKHRLPPLRCLAELWASVPTVLTTFPELDHYGQRMGKSYVGPINAMPALKRTAWLSEHTTKILVYLRATVPGVEALLEALQSLDAECIWVMPDAQQAWVDENCKSTNVRLMLHPIEMDALIPEVALMVTAGGSGTVASTLLGGVPLLIVPHTVEQYMTGRCIAALGAGFVVGNQRDSLIFLRVLKQLLAEPIHKRKALEFAQSYASYNAEESIEDTVLLIERAILGQKCCI